MQAERGGAQDVQQAPTREAAGPAAAPPESRGGGGGGPAQGPVDEATAAAADILRQAVAAAEADGLLDGGAQPGARGALAAAAEEVAARAAGRVAAEQGGGAPQGEAAAGGAPAAGAAAAAVEEEALDPTVVATHTYLGEVDDLEGSVGLLEEGKVYRMPVLPLDGLVLCPGNTLPLRLTFRGDRALVQQALSAPPPLSRLIAVVCCQRSYFTPQVMLQRVGCVAEIRKMGGGGISLLAKGRQRVEVQLEAVVESGLQLSSVPVRVLPEPLPLRVPPEARAGLAWHPCAFYAGYDSWQLAKRAQRLFHCIAPHAREFCGDPLELSYFLLSSLPVGDDVRQQLLEAKTVDERLRAEVKLLSALGVLRCRACGASLARSSDAIQMSEEGISACYVNSHSFVHDIVTLSQVSAEVALEGPPEAAHSWFPGYAWQCAYCPCGQHLGWKFTACRRGLQPASFWGLRRPALQAGSNREPGPLGGAGAFLHDGGSSDEEGEGVDDGWTTPEEEDLELGGGEGLSDEEEGEEAEEGAAAEGAAGSDAEMAPSSGGSAEAASDRGGSQAQVGAAGGAAAEPRAG